MALRPVNNQGSVTVSERKTVSFDVHVDPKMVYGEDQAIDEIVLTVNGKVIRRMNWYQAEKLGLVQKGNEW